MASCKVKIKFGLTLVADQTPVFFLKYPSPLIYPSSSFCKSGIGKLKNTCGIFLVLAPTPHKAHSFKKSIFVVLTAIESTFS